MGPLYAGIVQQSLEEAGYAVSTFTFVAGEASKRADTYVALLEHLAAFELTRGDVVVALGGGVTGDLAGFAAATYMRGCKLVQMPTSLLAMVDSSVGGKTAIDLEGGKTSPAPSGSPGSCSPTSAAWARSSPPSSPTGAERSSSHAVIADASLFEALEAAPLTLEALMRDLSFAGAVIARNVEIKRDVVAMDERESGPRKLLNLGHSIGHAIEARSAYARGHGSCVAAGMVAIAPRRGTQSAPARPALPARIDALCRAHGLDTSVGFGARRALRVRPARQEARGRRHRPRHPRAPRRLLHRARGARGVPRAHTPWAWRRARRRTRRASPASSPARFPAPVPAIASKSMAHRLIIAAALANGVTEIDCPTTCDDIEATVRCLVALGARVERDGGRLTVHPVPYSREHGILKALSGAELDLRRIRLDPALHAARRLRPGRAGALHRRRAPGRAALGTLADEIIAAGCDSPAWTRSRSRPRGACARGASCCPAT